MFRAVCVARHKIALMTRSLWFGNCSGRLGREAGGPPVEGGEEGGGEGEDDGNH